MLALQRPPNSSSAQGTPGLGDMVLDSSTFLEHSHGLAQDYSRSMQQQQQPSPPMIQIQSMNDPRTNRFHLHMQEQQQLAQLQQQQQQQQLQLQQLQQSQPQPQPTPPPSLPVPPVPPLQRPVGPLDKTGPSPPSPWASTDFPSLPRPQPTMNQGLLTQSFNGIHPLQQQQQQQQQPQQQPSRPLLNSNSFQAQRPGMSLMGHYGSEGGPMFAPQLSSPNTPSLGMDTSPGNNSTYSHHIQGLNQDSPMGYDYPRWNDPHKTHPTDMFHIASPPLTPSGVMARSPSSFSSFGAVNSVKRPPLWPMDRMPIMPFPRQTPTPSQASKAANLQHIPCKFFKSGACTAGKNCLFSHNRDSSPEQHVCKYFLKGNCKFGAKCSLSHSFLSLDRKSSALLPNSSGGGGRARLERRASSGAILNNLWPSEPMSPPYGSSLSQPSMQLQMGMDYSVGHSPSQQGFLKPSGRGGNTYDSPIDHGGDHSPFSDDCSPHATPMDMSERGSLNNIGMSSLGLERARQHLAAPLPIRQRSLPDIFRLAPMAPEGGINGSALPSSPFYQPGNKALFLSISCESSETNASSPLRLHSIPELHDLYNDSNPSLMERRRGSTAGGGYDDGGQNNMDGYSDSEDDMDSDQGFLPSSLNDLLTTGERQRRQSRQEDVFFETRLHPMMPSPLSESMPDEKSENGLGLSFELTRSASMATGMDNLMMVPGHFPPPMFAHHDRLNVFGEDGSSPPSGINHHSSSVGSNNSSGHSNSNAHYKERSGTPDPFCPFPQEVEEVQFKMDDDVVGPENHHQQQGSNAVFHAFANMDTNRQRAGLFEQGSTSGGGQEQQDKGLESLSMAFSGGMFISHPNE